MCEKEHSPDEFLCKTLLTLFMNGFKVGQHSRYSRIRSQTRVRLLLVLGGSIRRESHEITSNQKYHQDTRNEVVPTGFGRRHGFGADLGSVTVRLQRDCSTTTTQTHGIDMVFQKREKAIIIGGTRTETTIFWTMNGGTPRLRVRPKTHETKQGACLSGRGTPNPDDRRPSRTVKDRTSHVRSVKLRNVRPRLLYCTIKVLVTGKTKGGVRISASQSFHAPPATMTRLLG